MNMSRHLSDSKNGDVVQCDLSIAAEHAQQTGGTAPSFLRVRSSSKRLRKSVKLRKYFFSYGVDRSFS
jgi:hypothetical protein